MAYFSYKPILTDDYFAGKPLDIGHGPQVVGSDIIIEDTYRLELCQEYAKKFDGDAPIRPIGLPWEREMGRNSVEYDEEEGIYKTWYYTGGNADRSFRRQSSPVIGNMHICVGYLESKDGINWVRPELPEFTFAHYMKTNIVFGECEIGRIARNVDKTDPEKKYIFVYNADCGICLAYSRDGRHWVKDDEHNPVTCVQSDCSIQFGYDEGRKVWMIFERPDLYAKNEDLPGDGDWWNANYRRRVSVRESYDLIHWTPARIAHHSPESAFFTEADNLSFFTVGDYPMAFINKFRPYDLRYQHQVSFIATGRDAYHLKTPFPDDPTLDRGGYDDPDGSLAIIDSQGLDLFGDGRVYFYYRRFAFRDTGRNGADLGLVSYEKDRFLAQVGDIDGGWLLTREFILDGSSIEVNANIAKIGILTAEILEGCGKCDRTMTPIPGFTAGECDGIKGDTLSSKLTWNGSSDISSLRGRSVYIRFYVKFGRFYTFTVNE